MPLHTESVRHPKTAKQPEIEAKNYATLRETLVAVSLNALSTSRVGIVGRLLSLRRRLFNVGVASAATVRFDDFVEFETGSGTGS